MATTTSPRHAAPDTVLPGRHAGASRRPVLRVRVVAVTLLGCLAAMGLLNVVEANMSGTTAAAATLRAPAADPAAAEWVVTPFRVEVPDAAQPFGHRQAVVSHGVKVGWSTQFHIAATDERALLRGAAQALIATGWSVEVGRHDVFAVRQVAHRAEMFKGVTDCTGGRTSCTLSLLYASRQTP